MAGTGENALILSVDDDPDIRDLVSHALGTHGFEVVSAEHALAGLEAARERRPDLILLDAVMPGMSGFAMCEAMQSDPELCSVPVVFLTALDGEQDHSRMFASGAVDHLIKPFKRAKLIETVTHHLETAARFCDLVEAENHWTDRVMPADFLRFRDFLAELVGQTKSAASGLATMRPADVYQIAPALGLTQSEIANAMAEFLRVKRVDAITHDQILLEALPAAFCRKNLVVPVRTQAGPALALSNPFNWDLVETVKRFWDPGEPFHLVVTEPRTLLSLLTGAATSVADPSSPKDRVYRFGADQDQPAGADEQDPQVLATDGPIAFIANNMISAAVTQRASDVHIEPKDGTTVVRFRVDGDLRDFVSLNRTTASMLISRLKALAGLDIAERRKPQDGSLEAAVGERRFKLRLATTSTPSGESLIMRILEVTTSPRRLSDMGMTEHQCERLEDLSRRSQGLLLIVGATGSGKTTTIYSLLSQVDGKQRSILSIEDPVEYRIPLANQQQVNEKAGVTFESLLKSVVRQDPDVLFLGEVRDNYSAKMAVDFASTGHLTITSLHTTNSTTALFRLERLGVSREDMADAVLAIVAQRLVKRLCPACRQVRPITDAERKLLAPFTTDIPETVAEARGCPECDGTGYRGRQAVAEVFEFDPIIQAMLRRGRPVNEMRDSLRQRGTELLSDRAIAGVRDHTFALEDVYDRVLAEELASIEQARTAGPTERDETVASDKATAPARKPESAPDPARRPAEPVATQDADARILVVDDDPDSRALVERGLSSAGYGVSIAVDGASALVALGSQSFDLVVADIAMPMLDGFSLLQVIESQALGVPVILLTGSDVPEDEARALSLGAIDYIHKPARRDVLLARVARALRRAPATAAGVR